MYTARGTEVCRQISGTRNNEMVIKGRVEFDDGVTSRGITGKHYVKQGAANMGCSVTSKWGRGEFIG